MKRKIVSKGAERDYTLSSQKEYQGYFMRHIEPPFQVSLSLADNWEI